MQSVRLETGLCAHTGDKLLKTFSASLERLNKELIDITIICRKICRSLSLNLNIWQILITPLRFCSLFDTLQRTGQANLGNPFFTQLPSTDKMSNSRVLFQPTGFIENRSRLVFFLRIITTLVGTGTIKLDGEVIGALLFKRVPLSGFYYYEQATTNSTHSVETTNPGTQYFV